MRPAAILGALLGATVATGATAQVRTPRATQPVAATAYGPAPTNAKAVATGPNTIAVSWDAVAGVRSYLVERKRVDNPSCCVAMSGAITAAGWVDGTLEPGVEYGYTISVYYVDGRTGSVDVGAVTPMPPLPTVTLSRTARMAASGDVYSLTPCARRTTGGTAPSGLVATAESPAGLSFAWWGGGGYNYVVDRAPAGTVDWIMVGSTCGGASPIGPAGTNQLGVRDLAGGVQGGSYVYRVTAIGPGGETGWNTIHWTRPCTGHLSINTSVSGSDVSVWGTWSDCPSYSSTTIRRLPPQWVELTSSFGYSGRPSWDGRSYYKVIHGVAVGTHTFSAQSNWHNGGKAQSTVATVTVSY